MEWRQIDENTEIDNSLITCAEYQLFIDEQRKFSKPCQPFHWATYRFTPGNAKKPVTGVRLIDAQGFCNWLNQNYPNLGYTYRLPTLTETLQNPSNNPDLGCWVSDGEKYLIAGAQPKYWEEWRRNVADLLERNCTVDYLSLLIITLEEVSHRDINIVLSLQYALILARNLDGSEAVVRNHAFSKALERVYHLSRDSATTLGREMKRCQDLAKELESLRVFDTEFHLNRLRDLAQDIDQKLSKEKDIAVEINLVKDINLPQNRLKLTQFLNVIHELIAIRNRCLIHARSISRIFARDSARPVTLSLFQLCDLDFVLSHSLNIRLDIISNLDREFEEVLTVAKELKSSRIRDVEMLFEFARHVIRQQDFSSFRYYLLLISSCWHWLAYIYQKAAANSTNSSGSNYNEKSYESLAKEYQLKKGEILNLYACCILLKERKLGKIPAWEGIRLVRCWQG